jgi:coenzyme PQQ precursor peptide PqqA
MHGEQGVCQVRHGTCIWSCDGFGFDAEAIIQPCHNHQLLEITMQWTKPEYTDLRFGFEITMYIANR